MNPTKKEIEIAKKWAYGHFFSAWHLSSYRFKPDQRTRIGRLALSQYNELSENCSELRDEVLKKQVARRKNKPAAFSNVLSNPIVKDYRANRPFIEKIYPDRIVFSGYRNHWAKDEKDIRILRILRKLWMEKQKN